MNRQTVVRWGKQALLSRSRLSKTGERASVLFRLGALDLFKQTYLVVTEAAMVLQTSQAVVHQLMRIGALHLLDRKIQQAGRYSLLLRAEVVQFHQRETLSLPEAAAFFNRNTRDLLHLVEWGTFQPFPGREGS